MVAKKYKIGFDIDVVNASISNQIEKFSLILERQKIPMRLRIALFLVLFLSLAQLSYANNIQVTGTTLTQDPTTNTMAVQFNLSWDYSWRNTDAAIAAGTGNYDAAWVFMKYSVNGGKTWNHAKLKTSGTNPSGFSTGTGTPVEIKVPLDTGGVKVGGFIQRTSSAVTTTNKGEPVSAQGIKFIWDYGADSISHADAALATVKVFAIEMVYIPTGAFKLGSGLDSAGSDAGSEHTAFFKCTANVSTNRNTPYDITASSENNVICLGKTTGCGDGTNNLCWNPGMDYGATGGYKIGASYPKGYNAFYVMKYEISQGQYRDFLNMLTRTQQASHVYFMTDGGFSMNSSSSPPTPSYRNSIRNPSGVNSTEPYTFGCDLNNNGVFNEIDDGEWLAMNYILSNDLLAYAEWAGLRPMTELEFEKAARGVIAPVAGEYAWGTSSFLLIPNSISNAQTKDESVSISIPTGYGLVNSNGVISGPLRSGFAGTDTSTLRNLSGASYYGVMELSGNLWDLAVTAGHDSGRNFDGSNGKGILTTDGFASNQFWPGYSNGTNTSNVGMGQRGGSWESTVTTTSTTKPIRISSRWQADSVDATYPNARDQGGRCARTAPP